MSDLIKREDAIDAICELPVKVDSMGYTWMIANDVLKQIDDIPSVEPEWTAKVTLLNTGLHSVWGTCECGRQVEKPGRNDQSGAYYCPRCGAKLEWE